MDSVEIISVSAGSIYVAVVLIVTCYNMAIALAFGMFCVGYISHSF
jgi:hypothetical protein